MLWCVPIRAAASVYYNCFDHDSSFHNCDSPGNREFILVIGHLLGGFLKAEFVAVMRPTGDRPPEVRRTAGDDLVALLGWPSRPISVT